MTEAIVGTYDPYNDPQAAIGQMNALIRHATTRVTSNVPPEVAVRVESMKSMFEAACAGLPPAPMSVVIFHLSLPEENRYIKYADVAGDQGAIDYVSILKHSFAMTRGFNPEARIIYVTGTNDDCGFVPPDVVVVRLPLKPAWLMYERVLAVNAFIQSAAFSSNTVFLDSDAFPNWPIDRVFLLPFDVGVTYRTAPGLMPLNEGVIFASPRPGMTARRFFARYLGVYEALAVDQAVLDIYQDIRRWRGGQLSLNGCASAIGVMSEVWPRVIDGAVVQYLNCDDYNFAIRSGDSYPAKQLRRKYILHLKGPMKDGVDDIAAFQIKRLAAFKQAQSAAASQTA